MPEEAVFEVPDEVQAARAVQGPRRGRLVLRAVARPDAAGDRGERRSRAGLVRHEERVFGAGLRAGGAGVQDCFPINSDPPAVGSDVPAPPRVSGPRV